MRMDWCVLTRRPPSLFQPDSVGSDLRNGWFKPLLHRRAVRHFKSRSAFRPIRDLRLRAMLQNLLADRFKVGIHQETKEAPVYALTVAKGGSKLQHGKCAMYGRERRTGCAPPAGPETVSYFRCDKFDGVGLCCRHSIVFGSPCGR